MITAAEFIGAAAGRGFGLYAGVPCSYLTPFINYTISAGADPALPLRYVGAANEGDAIAIAAGAELGGRRSIVMFQNSGLGNAVNPLTSLTETFRIPVLVIVTWRGEPGGAPDEPQHELMGRITTGLLETMGLPWARFPVHAGDVAGVLDAAEDSRRDGKPFVLVMQKGSVAPAPLHAPPPAPRPPPAATASPAKRSASRSDLLRAVQAAARPTDVLVATTGYTGRELAALGDRPNQIYMVGSMGCASSLGLGLAIAQPKRRVIVLDGDGAALMRLGALATVGHEQPANLLHILIDNGLHESTGGQATVSDTVDFPAIAAACGYPAVEAVADPAVLGQRVAVAPAGLRFIHAPALPGVMPDLPRPAVTPPEVARRLRGWLAGES